MSKKAIYIWTCGCGWKAQIEPKGSAEIDDPWLREHLRLDAWAAKKSWAHPEYTGYEIKVSRSDFVNDNKWPQYMDYCERFYFVCPQGLIKKEDVPEATVGLMYYNPEKGTIRTVQKARRRKVEIPREFFQYLFMNRIMNTNMGFYTDKAEYFKEWMRAKAQDNILGQKVGKEIGKELARLRAEVRRYKTEYSGSISITEIQKILQKNDIPIKSWGVDDKATILKDLDDIIGGKKTAREQRKETEALEVAGDLLKRSEGIIERYLKELKGNDNDEQ